MSSEDIFKSMDNVKYGYLDKFGNKHFDITSDFSENYVLQTPEQVITNEIGICWDQVELERYYFGNKNTKTYFLVHYDNDKCPTHTFLVFENDNKFYWFEHSWELFRGIHEYISLKDLLLDVRDKFIKCELNGSFKKDYLCLYEYEKPKFNISASEFCKWCSSGTNIDLDKM
jgi:hypothetical protein